MSPARPAGYLVRASGGSWARPPADLSPALCAPGSARAGDQGGFTVTITVPPSTAAGPHELIAAGSDGRRADAAITVS